MGRRAVTVSQKDGVLSRVLDDRGRLFGKVNIVDLVVLVVIVALVAFAAIRLWGGGSVETVPVKVSFVAGKVDRALVPGFRSTGTVTDLGGNVIGQLQSVTAAPTMEEFVTPDGQLEAFASTTHSDVTFVVLGEGTVSDSTVYVGRLAARVGADLKLLGPGFEVQTKIVSVSSGAEASK